jgi:hypothetical protein
MVKLLRSGSAAEFNSIVEARPRKPCDQGPADLPRISAMSVAKTGMADGLFGELGTQLIFMAQANVDGRATGRYRCASSAIIRAFVAISATRPFPVQMDSSEPERVYLQKFRA